MRIHGTGTTESPEWPLASFVCLEGSPTRRTKLHTSPTRAAEDRNDSSLWVGRRCTFRKKMKKKDAFPVQGGRANLICMYSRERRYTLCRTTVPELEETFTLGSHQLGVTGKKLQGQHCASSPTRALYIHQKRRHTATRRGFFTWRRRGE